MNYRLVITVEHLAHILKLSCQNQQLTSLKALPNGTSAGSNPRTPNERYKNNKFIMECRKASIENPTSIVHASLGHLFVCGPQVSFSFLDLFIGSDIPWCQSETNCNVTRGS